MARRKARRLRAARTDPSTALAAALLFGIQTFVMALWMSAHALPSEPGAFGSLCIWQASRNAEETPQQPTPAPDCCAFGCVFAGASLHTEPARLPLVDAAPAPVVYPRPQAAPGRAMDRASLRLRGPPLLA